MDPEGHAALACDPDLIAGGMPPLTGAKQHKQNIQLQIRTSTSSRGGRPRCRWKRCLRVSSMCVHSSGGVGHQLLLCRSMRLRILMVCLHPCLADETVQLPRQPRIGANDVRVFMSDLSMWFLNLTHLCSNWVFRSQHPVPAVEFAHAVVVCACPAPHQERAR